MKIKKMIKEKMTMTATMTTTMTMMTGNGFKNLDLNTVS
jgi:hypothetical protein